MSKGRRAAGLLLLAAAVGLAILGQVYFLRRQEYVWDGLVFHLLAALCFLLAWRLGRPPAPRVTSRWTLGLGEWLRARPVPAGLLGLGLLLSAAATLLTGDRPLDQASGASVGPWLLALAALLLAALWPDAWPPRALDDWRRRLRNVGRSTWLEVASVAALTLLAWLLRAAALGSVPYTLGGDEAWHGLLARQVLNGQMRNPFAMGYMSMPTFFYWPLSWSLWLVGDGMVGLRLPAALVGTITVPLLYLLARDLWGRRTALIAALFLATYDYHIHYSRLGANNVWDPLFVLLVMWALDRGLRHKGPGAYRLFLWAGVGLGLSFYFYTGARLLPLLITAYVAFCWWRARVGGRAPEATGEAQSKTPPGRGLGHRGQGPEQVGQGLGQSALEAAGGGQSKTPPGRGLEQEGQGQGQAVIARSGAMKQSLLLLLLACLIAAGPMLGYALAHPGEWNARINQVGILQSGWLAREPELTGKSTAYILAEQFLRSAGAFHLFADRTVWYGSWQPLLGFLAGVFALLGLAWALARWRERRYFLVLLWFWSVIITGGMLTESPPSSQRLVMTIPAVALLVAFGLEKSVDLVRLLLPLERRWADLVMGLLVVGLVVSSVRYYFVEFTPARRYGSENGETATMIGHYLQDLEGEYQAYLFGAPRIYWNFGTMSFLAPRVPGTDVVEPLTGPPDFADQVPAGQGVVFLFLPERMGEMAWVQAAFPGGSLREFRDAGGRLRFTVYHLP